MSVHNKAFHLHVHTVSIEIKPGQLRCGEHMDYGSITLLFQDPSGGLRVFLGGIPCLQSDKVFSHFQVKRSDGGGYIDVPYIADAILVNLGALMQHAVDQ